VRIFGVPQDKIDRHADSLTAGESSNSYSSDLMGWIELSFTGWVTFRLVFWLVIVLIMFNSSIAVSRVVMTMGWPGIG
jgi:hypothetical protein